MKDQIFKISCMSNASRVESVNSDRCNNLYFFPIFCIPFKWLAEQAIDTCVSLGLQMRSPVVISLHTYDHLVPFISVGVTRISRQELTWGRCFKLYTWYSKISLDDWHSYVISSSFCCHRWDFVVSQHNCVRLASNLLRSFDCSQ